MPAALEVVADSLDGLMELALNLPSLRRERGRMQYLGLRHSRRWGRGNIVIVAHKEFGLGGQVGLG